MHKMTHLNPSSEFHLVFLHGWGMNSGVFSDFIQQLQERFVCESNVSVKTTALDLPGYGEFASMEAATMSVKSKAVFVEALLEPNTILVGWSLGGLVAQKIAIQQSEKLQGLICLCSSPKFASHGDWKGIEPDVLHNFEQQLASDPAKTLKRFLAIQNLGQTSAKANIQKMFNSLIGKMMASSETLKRGLHILENEDLRHEIADISIPTLRVYGGFDSLVPSPSIARIADLQPEATHIIYEKASHAPFISHPQSLIEDIVRFVKSIKKD
jgi:pimeloyl-[acyl-carrier protein] methyl ester esterase